ncbi:Malate dehydrogenase [Candidatus Methanoperedenaceae archaeon GB37]|nr:Malate dehydrogenase [Candidatus Methanoperedenaceae archaeon GB37]
MVKISVVGAGMVGATLVQRLAESELGDLVMIDVVDGLPQGKALDLMESAPLCGFDVDVVGSNDYRDIESSDVVVVTAGLPRKPGMTRDDLIRINSGIIRDISSKVVEYASSAILLVVTNPLDLMTYAALKYTGFEPHRVLGMGGVLDSARFAYFIALELDCSPTDVQAMVIGSHGDMMLPLPEYTTVSGIPIRELLSSDALSRSVSRTVNAGAEIVDLLKTGSAFYAPSAAIVRMVEAVVHNQRRIMPASVYLDGKYGLKDICIGLPVRLGRGGVLDVIELDLQSETMDALHRSTDSLRTLISSLEL